MYIPLNLKQGRNTKVTTSLLPKKGMNLAGLPQMMALDYALEITNYIPHEYGLESRKGLTQLFNKSGVTDASLLVHFTGDLWFMAYGTTLEVYDESTETFTTIKSDFSSNDGFNGERYGDYFFICNGIDKIYRVSRTLSYDGQTGDFTAGKVITGGTSGATAVILEDSDSGTTGTLTLGEVSGTFQDDEIITDTETGSATVNGTIGWTADEVTNSPVSTNLTFIGPRCYAWKGDTVRYSEVDDGSNPPFDAWSNTTDVSAGGKVSYRNAGTVRSVTQQGQFTVVFSDKGFYAFYINALDSAGTVKKTEIIQNYTEDYGGATGAISTPVGIFYVNEAGLWRMVAVGQSDTPLTRQQRLESVLLGSKYFKGVDQTSIELVHDANQKCIFVTLAKDSTKNNLVLGYKLEDTDGMFQIKGWNIAKFAKKGDDVYGLSSLNGKAYKLFEGYDDDGLKIGTIYEQELPLQTLYNKHSLNKFYIAGWLSPSDSKTIRFDIYDVDGKYVKDKYKLEWTAQSEALSADGWGSAKLGESAFGSNINSDTLGLVESFDGGSPRINNFQRLRVRITGGSKMKHILNWFSAITVQKGQIRRRNLENIT